MNTTELTPTTSPENNTLELPFIPAATVPAAPFDDPQVDPVADAGQTDPVDHRPSDIVNVRQVDIDALQPHPTNAAVYGDEPVDDDLVASIKALGVLAPLHANAEHIVVDGHRRLKAARAAERKIVPVIFLDSRLDAVTIEELLLEANRSRNKNNEQRVREFAAYLRIESARARTRMLKGTPVLKSTQGDAEKPVGKAREIAARKVGWSGATAKKGLKIVKVLDRLLADGDPDAAKLRKLLHDKKVEAAHNAAVSHGWIKGEPKTPTRKPVAESKAVATTKDDHPQPGDATQAGDIVDSTAGSLQPSPQAPQPIATAVTAAPDSGTEVATIFRDQPQPEQEDSAQPSTTNAQTSPPSAVPTAAPVTAPAPTAASVAEGGSTRTSFQLADGSVMVADIAEEGGMIPAARVRKIIQALQGSLEGTDQAVIAGQQRIVISVAEALNRHAVKLPTLTEREVNNHLKRAVFTLQNVMKWR